VTLFDNQEPKMVLAKTILRPLCCKPQDVLLINWYHSTWLES